MLNDLLIQKNTPYILKTCVKADRSAIESFRKLINSRELQESTIGILRPHYEKMVDQVENFEKEIEEYPWR